MSPGQMLEHLRGTCIHSRSISTKKRDICGDVLLAFMPRTVLLSDQSRQAKSPSSLPPNNSASANWAKCSKKQNEWQQHVWNAQMSVSTDAKSTPTHFVFPASAHHLECGLGFWILDLGCWSRFSVIPPHPVDVLAHPRNDQHVVNSTKA